MSNPANPFSLRIGQGFDIHRLKRGRPCRIGGIDIPSPVGPDGHSDGDVLLHALCDALLGATGKTDIGDLFPNTDPQLKDIDSTVLLTKVYQLIQADHWSIVNLDLTVIAETPKIGPYRTAIQERIASLLEIQPDQVGLKATTNERIGELGRGLGIAAFAVVLLHR